MKGRPNPDQAVLTDYLIKNARFSKVNIQPHPTEGAKKCLTEYQILQAGEVSRLLVLLHTGRTHQIRAQLSFHGHPILGDDVYGDYRFNRAYSHRGLCLSAVKIGFDTKGKVPEIDGLSVEIEDPFEHDILLSHTDLR